MIEPTVQQMAAAASIGYRGEYFVPMITWEKQFPGQVTDGRIGRPVIRFCPVSWLPEKIGQAVLRAIRSEAVE